MMLLVGILAAFVGLALGSVLALVFFLLHDMRKAVAHLDEAASQMQGTMGALTLTMTEAIGALNAIKSTVENQAQKVYRRKDRVQAAVDTEVNRIWTNPQILTEAELEELRRTSAEVGNE